MRIRKMLSVFNILWMDTLKLNLEVSAIPPIQRGDPLKEAPAIPGVSFFHHLIEKRQLVFCKLAFTVFYIGLIF